VASEAREVPANGWPLAATSRLGIIQFEPIGRTPPLDAGAHVRLLRRNDEHTATMLVQSKGLMGLNRKRPANNWRALPSRW
jgi:hypothetical protein